jgi:hypothetical protein
MNESIIKISFWTFYEFSPECAGSFALKEGPRNEMRVPG